MNDSQVQSRRARLHAEKGGVTMHMTRLCLLVAIWLPLAAGGCIERLPPRPPPEVPPYPQEKFDSPLNAWHWYQRAIDLLGREDERVQFPAGRSGIARCFSSSCALPVRRQQRYARRRPPIKVPPTASNSSAVGSGTTP